MANNRIYWKWDMGVPIPDDVEKCHRVLADKLQAEPTPESPITKQIDRDAAMQSVCLEASFQKDRSQNAKWSPRDYQFAYDRYSIQLPKKIHSRLKMEAEWEVFGQLWDGVQLMFEDLDTYLFESLFQDRALVLPAMRSQYLDGSVMMA